MSTDETSEWERDVEETLDNLIDALRDANAGQKPYQNLWIKGVAFCGSDFLLKTLLRLRERLEEVEEELRVERNDCFVCGGTENPSGPGCICNDTGRAEVGQRNALDQLRAARRRADRLEEAVREAQKFVQVEFSHVEQGNRIWHTDSAKELYDRLLSALDSREDEGEWLYGDCVTCDAPAGEPCAPDCEADPENCDCPVHADEPEGDAERICGVEGWSPVVECTRPEGHDGQHRSDPRSVPNGVEWREWPADEPEGDEDQPTRLHFWYCSDCRAMMPLEWSTCGRCGAARPTDDCDECGHPLDSHGYTGCRFCDCDHDALSDLPGPDVQPTDEPEGGEDSCDEIINLVYANPVDDLTNEQLLRAVAMYAECPKMGPVTFRAAKDELLMRLADEPEGDEEHIDHIAVRRGDGTLEIFEKTCGVRPPGEEGRRLAREEIESCPELQDTIRRLNDEDERDSPADSDSSGGVASGRSRDRSSVSVGDAPTDEPVSGEGAKIVAVCSNDECEDDHEYELDDGAVMDPAGCGNCGHPYTIHLRSATHADARSEGERDA